MAPGEPGGEAGGMTPRSEPAAEAALEGVVEAAAEPAAEIGVEVVYAPAAHAVDLSALHLRAGATVADALHASGVLQRHDLVLVELALGVWGRACNRAQPLREGDRVEIYRPLRVDPKQARRLRAQANAPSVPVRRPRARRA